MSLLQGKNLFDVSGKVVLITGAGSGLGEGYALAFGESGATVLCAGRNLQRLEHTVTEITGQGGSARAYQVDVTDLSSIRALVEAAGLQLVARGGTLGGGDCLWPAPAGGPPGRD